MAKSIDLTIDQGSIFYANLQHLDDNKAPISLAGYTIASQIRRSYYSANAASFSVSSTDLANGKIQLSFTSTQTGLIKPGRYVYDVEATSGSSTIRIFEGDVTVTPGVTGNTFGTIFVSTDAIRGPAGNIGVSNSLISGAYSVTLDDTGTITLPTVLAGNTSIGTAFNANPPGHTLTLKHNNGVTDGSGGELKFGYGTAEIKVVKDAGDTKTWTFDSEGDVKLPVSGGIVFDRNNTSIRVGMGFHIASAEGIDLQAIDNTDANNLIYSSWYFNPDGNLTVPANGIITAPNAQEFQLQAKDTNSLLRNEINLDPNNGTYMSVWSGELDTSFSTSDWDTASWVSESIEGENVGKAHFTNAETLYNFWNTGLGSVINNIEVSINGGSRISVQYDTGNSITSNVSLDLANGQPSGVPPTSPTTITSLVFYYRTQSKIEIDYDGGEILLDGQALSINLKTTDNLDLRAGQNLNLRALGAYPVRIYTDNNTHMWEFDNTGSLTLPSEGKIYGIGLGPAGDRSGYISWSGNSSGDGLGYNTLRLVPDLQGLEDADQYIILDPTSPGHIHIRAGGTQDNSQAILYFGGENSYVKVDSGPNPPVSIAASNNIWTFGTSGNLTFPDSSTQSGGALPLANLKAIVASSPTWEDFQANIAAL